jgi:predicted outer membrane protein
VNEIDWKVDIAQKFERFDRHGARNDIATHNDPINALATNLL